MTEKDSPTPTNPRAQDTPARRITTHDLRRKSRNKKKERRNLLIGGSVLAVVVLVLIGTGIGFAYWQQHKGKVDPTTLAITVDAGGTKTEAKPFQACALGETCSENSTTKVKLSANGEMTITVPPAVSDTQWSLLTIYADDSKNDQTYYKGNEKDTVTVKGSKDGSKLTVAEIHSVVVGEHNGEENAYTMVWALSPQ